MNNEKIKGWANSAAENTRSTVDKVSDKVDHAADRMAEKGREAANRVKEGIHKATHRVDWNSIAREFIRSVNRCRK